MANVALRAAERSAKSVAVYDLRYIKPLDEEMLDYIGSRFSKVITIEDGVVRGGVGEAIAAYLSRQGYTPRVKNLGIGDTFVEHGKPAELYADCAYDEAALIETIETI
jgi:1-deoxy-D-xylulose-5-phosphate synthase